MIYSFASYKALGDLVIAVSSIERVPIEQRSNIRLVFGSHLRDLVDAIEPGFETEIFDVGESHVPSIFDIRKNGIVKATRSAIAMRASLRRRFHRKGELAILDKAGIREKLIAHGICRASLPSSDNIYNAYFRILADAGFEMAQPGYQKGGSAATVGIFPGSRVAAKNIPSEAIDKLEAVAETISLHSTLFLLDGERRDLEKSGRAYEPVARTFRSLISAIEAVDLVVSADSLPAHLAERMGKPVFVVSPKENPYWLPLSSFQSGRHSLFADIDISEKLSQFMKKTD
jgi:hypothetical protein